VLLIALKFRLAVKQKPVDSFYENVFCLNHTLFTQSEGNFSKFILKNVYTLVKIIDGEFVDLIDNFFGLSAVLGREMLDVKFKSSYFCGLQNGFLLTFFYLL
jgi:hypothetical protein